jgi:hypothetical protein
MPIRDAEPRRPTHDTLVLRPSLSHTVLLRDARHSQPDRVCGTFVWEMSVPVILESKGGFEIELFPGFVGFEEKEAN